MKYWSQYRMRLSKGSHSKMNISILLQNNIKQHVDRASGHSIGNRNPCVYKVIMPTMEFFTLLDI